jgi:hypothetical protein
MTAHAVPQIRERVNAAIASPDAGQKNAALAEAAQFIETMNQAMEGMRSEIERLKAAR